MFLSSLIVYTSIIIWIAWWQQKKVKSKLASVKEKQTDPAPRNALEHVPDNWIDQWLHDRGYAHFIHRSEHGTTYFLDLDLQSSRVNVILSFEINTGNSVVNIFHPLIVKKSQYASVKRFIDNSFLFHDEYRFLFNPDTGKFFIHFPAQGALLNVLTSRERDRKMLELLQFADQSFPDITRLLYGSSIPEVTALKIQGFSKVALN